MLHVRAGDDRLERRHPRERGFDELETAFKERLTLGKVSTGAHNGRGDWRN